MLAVWRDLQFLIVGGLVLASVPALVVAVVWSEGLLSGYFKSLARALTSELLRRCQAIPFGRDHVDKDADGYNAPGGVQLPEGERSAKHATESVGSK